MNTEPVFSTVTTAAAALSYSVDDYRSPARRSLLSSSSADPPPPPHTHNHSHQQPAATSSVAAAHDTSATTTRILEFKAESEQLRKVYELRERQLKSQLGLETQKMEVDLRVARESLEAERAKRIDAAAAASRDAEELRREAARVQAQADERLRTVRAQHAEEVSALAREMRAVHAAATTTTTTTAAPAAAAAGELKLREEAVRQASALLHKQSVYIQNLEGKLEEVEARACAEHERAARGEDVADARRTGVLEARVVSLAAQLEAREEEMAQLRRSKDLEIEQLDRMLKQEAARAAKAVKEQIDAVRDVERATGGEVAELQALVKDLLGQQKQRETLCDALKAQLAKKEQELAAVHPFQQQQHQLQHNGTNLFAVSPSSVGVSPPSAGESVRRAAAAAAAALSPAPLPAPALHGLEATAAEGAAHAQAQQAEDDAAAGRPQEAVRDAYQSLWHEERMRLERVVREKTAENEKMRQGLDSMFERLSVDAETRDEEKQVWQSRVANLEEALIRLLGGSVDDDDDAGEDAAAAQSPSSSPPPPSQQPQQQQQQQPPSATVQNADAAAPSPPLQQALEEISGLLDRSPNMSGISFHHPDDSEAPPAQRRSSSVSGGGGGGGSQGAASGRRRSSVGGDGRGQEASQTFDQDILLRIDQHLHKMLAHREVTEEATLKRELQDKREEVSHLTKKYKSAKGKLAKEVRDREGLSKQVANLSVMLDAHIGESRKAAREHAPQASSSSAQQRSASSTRRAAGAAAARSGSAQPVATLRRHHSPAPAQPRITKTKRCPWHSRG